MVQAPAKLLTLDEFLAQPETKPASELINGLIISKPMPQGRHSTIQGELVTAINAFTKPERTAWAFPELRCSFVDTLSSKETEILLTKQPLEEAKV